MVDYLIQIIFHRFKKLNLIHISSGTYYNAMQVLSIYIENLIS